MASPEKPCDHDMRIGAIHNFVVGQLKDSFCSLEFFADQIYILKTLFITKFVEETISELVKTIELILIEYLSFFSEVSEDCMPLAGECELISCGVWDPSAC